MNRGFLQNLRGVADWLIHKPINRLISICVFWAIVIVALALYADPLVWLGLILGILVPVSIWIAWEGFALPEVRHLDYFLALTPAEFEHAVADLVVPLGYTDVRVVGGAADLGVDVLCRDRKGRKVAIQVKRYQPGNDISSSAVQTFMGGMVAHEADRGIIVTTSSFSGPARDLAENQDIQLIDGAELTRMLEQEEVALELR